MSMLDQIVGDVDQIPAGVWMGALGANVVLTIATWSVARRRLRPVSYTHLTLPTT